MASCCCSLPATFSALSVEPLNGALGGEHLEGGGYAFSALSVEPLNGAGWRRREGPLLRLDLSVLSLLSR